MHWRASAGGWAAGFAWTVSDRHPDVCASSAPTNASTIQHFASREVFKCLTTQVQQPMQKTTYNYRVLHVPSFQNSTTVQYIDSALERAQCVWAGVDSKQILMNIQCTVHAPGWMGFRQRNLGSKSIWKASKTNIFFEFMNQICFTQIDLLVIRDQHWIIISIL